MRIDFVGFYQGGPGSPTCGMFAAAEAYANDPWNPYTAQIAKGKTAAHHWDDSVEVEASWFVVGLHQKDLTT
jgi:hypothetical protein